MDIVDYTAKLYEFEIYLYEEERSVNTVKKYVRDVKLFLEFLEDKELSKQCLLGFKEELIKKYASSSVNSMIASINKFLCFIQMKTLKLKPIKVQKEIFANPKTELTENEYRRLLRVAKNLKNDRIYFIIQTICMTGTRVSELEYITTNSLDIGRTTVRCKGKQRVVLIPKELRKILKSYCKEHNITDGMVFQTKNGKSIDRSNIWKMMKRLCRLAGVLESKVFPHNLRHLFARVYYKIEKDISKLADILGHSNINTTRLYIMETGKLHERQINKLSLMLCDRLETT